GGTPSPGRPPSPVAGGICAPRTRSCSHRATTHLTRFCPRTWGRSLPSGTFLLPVPFRPLPGRPLGFLSVSGLSSTLLRLRRLFDAFCFPVWTSRTDTTSPPQDQGLPVGGEAAEQRAWRAWRVPHCGQRPGVDELVRLDVVKADAAVRAREG